MITFNIIILHEIVNGYIFENAKQKKDKMLGKIVRIKERNKKRFRNVFAYSLKSAICLTY